MRKMLGRRAMLRGAFGAGIGLPWLEAMAPRRAEARSTAIRRFVVMFTPNGTLQNTCSIGVATFPDGGSDWEVLFKAADEALYASKRAGRDRVTVWSQRLEPAKAG